MPAGVVLAGEARVAAPARGARRDHHALPGRDPLHRRSQREHLARDVVAEDVGQGDGPARFPLARPEVEVVQRARAHAHQGLARPRDRIGDLLVAEDLGPTVLVDEDGLHG